MRGYTLIEALIVVTITSFSLMALLYLYMSFQKIHGYETTYMKTVGSAGSALTSFEAAILPAEAVLASRTISGTTYTSGTTTLVLQLPAVDGSGSVVSGVKDYIVFYASSTNLYRTVSAGAGSIRTSGTKLLSGTLSSLVCTYDTPTPSNAESVTVDIQTQSYFKTQLIQGRAKEILYLRNASST